jgi:hypothetical protein
VCRDSRREHAPISRLIARRRGKSNRPTRCAATGCSRTSCEVVLADLQIRRAGPHHLRIGSSMSESCLSGLQ